MPVTPDSQTGKPSRRPSSAPSVMIPIGDVHYSPGRIGEPLPPKPEITSPSFGNWSDDESSSCAKGATGELVGSNDKHNTSNSATAGSNGPSKRKEKTKTVMDTSNGDNVLFIRGQGPDAGDQILLGFNLIADAMRPKLPSWLNLKFLLAGGLVCTGLVILARTPGTSGTPVITTNELAGQMFAQHGEAKHQFQGVNYKLDMITVGLEEHGVMLEDHKIKLEDHKVRLEDHKVKLEIQQEQIDSTRRELHQLSGHQVRLKNDFYSTRENLKKDLLGMKKDMESGAQGFKEEMKLQLEQLTAKMLLVEERETQRQSEVKRHKESLMAKLDADAVAKKKKEKKWIDM